MMQGRDTTGTQQERKNYLEEKQGEEDRWGGWESVHMVQGEDNGKGRRKEDGQGGSKKVHVLQVPGGYS